MNQTAPFLGTAKFTVGATGDPAPSITWYRNGGQTWSGWTGTSLTLDGISSNDEGTYYAVASNSAGSATSATATLTLGTATGPIVPTLPAGAVSYVTDVPQLGTPRNNFSGWVGMEIVVGSEPLTVTQLGRIVVSGNTGTHTVKLVRKSDGADLGSTTVATAGGTAGQVLYAPLPSSITLPPGGTFLLLSEETAGGDTWYDWNTQVTTTAVAGTTAAAYGWSGQYGYHSAGWENSSYVPVSFVYSESSGESLALVRIKFRRSHPALGTRQPQTDSGLMRSGAG